MIKENVQFDWRSFRDHAATAFSSSFSDPALADVTLVADGSVSLFAHKFVLSSASPVLKQFFASNPSIYNPCLLMFGVSADVLNAILEFIYRGETVVPYENLDAFVMAAKYLQLSLNKVPEQISNNKKNVKKEINQATTKIQNVNNIPREKETVLIGNIHASKDKKTIYNDYKAETFQENEIQGTTRQGSHTLAFSENTRDIKIKRVVQEKKFKESFKCVHCSKTFDFKTTLRNHTLIKHS